MTDKVTHHYKAIPRTAFDKRAVKNHSKYQAEKTLFKYSGSFLQIGRNRFFHCSKKQKILLALNILRIVLYIDSFRSILSSDLGLNFFESCLRTLQKPEQSFGAKLPV